MTINPKTLVEAGYDSMAEAYLAAKGRCEESAIVYADLEKLVAMLPEGARVLDLGCGAGVPATRWLAERFQVTGVDISDRQLELARQHVPDANFIKADMGALTFSDGVFDGIVSFYAIVHLPREEQATLVKNIHRWLEPGGIFLSNWAVGEWEGTEEDWEGWGSPMWWSHYGKEYNLSMLRDAGFAILSAEVRTSNDETWLWVLAQRQRIATKGRGRTMITNVDSPKTGDRVTTPKTAAADPPIVGALLAPRAGVIPQTEQTTQVDWARIRADFPILSRTVHGKPLVFLDSTATSQKPQVVLDAMDAYYRTTNANIHRGVYELSEVATQQYEGARARIARFIGAKSRREIIYTRNATEALNLVAHTWARANLHEGDVVLLSKMEHHSNLVPWQMLSTERGISLRYLDVTRDGLLDLSNLDEMLRGVKLVSVTQMSNVLGTINPVEEIIERAHKADALVMLDAAQSVPHLPVNVQALDVDFLAFSGHKMCGPTGIGILYGKRQFLEEMPPFMGGGDMINTVTLEGFTPNQLPWKFEAGTPAIAEAIGLGAAVDYLSQIGMENIHAHEQELTAYALDLFHDLPGVTVYGPDASQKGGVVAFAVEGVHPHDVATILDGEGICVRAGHHCCQPLMHHLEVPALARASFYLYTTKGDIDALVEGVKKVQVIFA